MKVPLTSMRGSEAPRLADLTTLRVGGPPATYVEARTDDELIAAAEPGAFLLGGGSNVVAADEGYAGTVVAVRTTGVEVQADACAGIWVEAAAGESWDALVARAVAEQWSGVEALSGIPGTVGAAPLQNIGAYGQQLSDTLARVRTYDRVARTVRTFAAADAGFGYRTSRFKTEPGRYAVLSVALQLRPGPRSAPVRYAELADRLGVAVGATAPLSDVRDAVLELRRGKGMVLDPTDPDTCSVGSFFLNPVLPADRVPPGAPAYPQPDGTVKTSAAWLIAGAGIAKGHALPGSAAAVSTKHTLAIANRGGATAGQVLDLARDLRARVHAAYGITLEPEPVLLGVEL